MTRTHAIASTLRSLDVADHRADAGCARAREDLRSILASDPAPQPRQRARTTGGERVDPARRPARGRRRLVLTGLAVAAAVALPFVLPPLTGGDQAFASWTPAPAALSAKERGAAASGCREAQERGAGAGYRDELRAARPVLTERRGVWTTVVLAGRGGFSATCITDGSAGLFTGDLIGSVGTPTAGAAPGPGELTATDLGTGTLRAGAVSLAEGTAGTAVVGVVYRSRTRGDVHATVAGGRFVFWLPGDELRDAPTAGIDVEVTYRDGRTRISRLRL